MNQHKYPLLIECFVRSIFLIDTELAFTTPERILHGKHFNGDCLMALARIRGVAK